MAEDLELQNEINKLIKLANKWHNTLMNKSNANRLISEIEIFKHTISVELPNTSKIFGNNHRTEMKFSDGISKLKKYSESNLKIKDDHYFKDGILDLIFAVNDLIKGLKK